MTGHFSGKPTIILQTPFNLGPYHRARYQKLQQNEINLVVVKMPVKEHHRPWQAGDVDVNFKVLTPFTNNMSMHALLHNVITLLRRERPVAVICVGYYGRYVFAISLACKIAAIPCVLYLVGWDNDSTRNRIKELLKHWYVKGLFSAALATGKRAATYAELLGIPSERIYIIGNVVDNAHFAVPQEHSNGTLPKKFFLMVSRLSPEKNINGLLRAFEIYCENGGQWDLCIAGTGPAESDLKRLVSPAWFHRVHWLGWVDYDHLPGVYQASECFVLTSFVEPWGLVVNEAMAAGKPVLVSTKCGCQPELCKEGANGYSFSPYDNEFIASLMHRMEELGISKVREMGQVSCNIISEYSLESWRDKFVGAITKIVNQPL